MIKEFARIIVLRDRIHDTFWSKNNQTKPKRRHWSYTEKGLKFRRGYRRGSSGMERGKLTLCLSLSILALLPRCHFWVPHHEHIQEHFRSIVHKFSREAATEPFLCRAYYAVMCNINREIKISLLQKFYLNSVVRPLNAVTIILNYALKSYDIIT